MVVGSSRVAVISTSDVTPVLRKDFFFTEAAIGCGFTLKGIHDKNIHSNEPYR